MARIRTAGGEGTRWVAAVLAGLGLLVVLLLWRSTGGLAAASPAAVAAIYQVPAVAARAHLACRLSAHEPTNWLSHRGATSTSGRRLLCLARCAGPSQPTQHTAGQRGRQRRRRRRRQ